MKDDTLKRIVAIQSELDKLGNDEFYELKICRCYITVSISGKFWVADRGFDDTPSQLDAILSDIKRES